MSRIPDFIGLGAQRAGTSWIYACLYEHPQVCVPEKEIHFFSRDRNWTKGFHGYEAIFEKCPPDARVGEFSTSYLADPATPERIHTRYPDVKLIASLRNPVDRAYSNYMNDILAGVVDQRTPFRGALNEHPEYIEQGCYAVHLTHYLEYFAREQILVLIYEDSLRDPIAFIKAIYRFIKVDPSFVPDMLLAKINVSRVPLFPLIDQAMIKTSGFLRRWGLSNLWWFGKKAGLGRGIRALNTRYVASMKQGLDPSNKRFLYRALKNDIGALEDLLGRKLTEWCI